MKRLLMLAAMGFCLLPTMGRGAQTAQARLYCWSLRFQQGHDGSDTEDFSTISGTPNGELAPWFGARSHYSGFIAYYFGAPIEGTMYLDVPLTADANGNGFPDFFEVSQGVSGEVTSGEYTGSESGTVTATWNRAAGSKDGTCVITLEDDIFGTLGDYSHTFELIEYTGPLTYTPGSNAVSGSVNLTQTGNPANQFQGPVAFVKVATNRFNRLTLQAGGWTNAATQMLTFANDLFLRDLSLLTNYYGYVQFDDGDPNTADPDYWLWELSIDDVNDSDHDGIPDFSDDPVAARRPMLTLARGTTNLLLTISGDVGRLHEIQQVSTLTSTNWQLVSSITLTNDPQVVSLPLPSSAPSFLRARVP
ncbi:MAG: hypothetical protein HY298_18630 [Verrucomicrobia bacterium]|nr:hypothetical protein [Verrucomicrobiota bacterium]